MENRLRLALALCALIVLGWLLFFGPKKPTQPSQNTPPVTQPLPGGQPTASPPPTTSGPANNIPSPSSTIATGTPPNVPSSAGKIILVESIGVYRAKLSDQGLFSFLILEEKYKSNNQRILLAPQGNTPPEVKTLEGYHETEMIPTYRPSLVLGFPNSQFVIPADAAWTLEPPKDTADCQLTEESTGTHTYVPEAGCKMTYRLELPNQVLIRKILSFYRNAHRIDVQIEVTNETNGVLSHHLSIGLESFQDPKKPGFLSPKIPPHEPMWDFAGSLNKTNLDDLIEKKELDKTQGDVRWFGINQQYFIQALVLQPEKIAGNRKLAVFGDPTGILSTNSQFEERLLKTQEKTSYLFAFYAGPKIPERLSAINLSNTPEETSGLEKSIDYTLGILARPLLWTLRQIYQLVHSWAAAIVLLTLLIKILTIYPTYRSNQSMKTMAELKPQIDELQERYKDDKQRLNVEIANLYKRHGINPLGGCLPMLLQMPIYLALYSMIGNSIELYRAPFISTRWIPDLTAADPYFLLPLLTGGTMFLQTRLSPSSADPQQKTMAYLMPLIFTGFSIFLPAGLTLYIFTNTLLGMIQQLVTNRLQKKTKPPKK